MSDHLRMCRYLRGRTKSELYDIFDDIPMNDIDLRIMDMRYIQRRRFFDIGEALHLSEDAVKRRHAKIVSAILRAG